MRIVFRATIAAAILLTGCASPQRFAMSPAEQQRIMQEVSAQRRVIQENFQRYIDVCVDQFPDGREAANDEDQHLSANGAVNVAMKSGGRDIVCSVNMASMKVERVFQGNRTLPLDEYKAYALRNPIIGDSGVAVEVEPDPPEGDPRLSYKGVRLGDSQARVQSKLPQYECRDGRCTFGQSSCGNKYLSNPKSALKICEYGTSYGGAVIKRGFITFIDGKAATIRLTLESAQIPFLEVVLVEKYGNPKAVDETPFMNKVGTQFPNAKRSWIIEGEALTTTLRGAVVDEGNVDIRGSAAQQMSRESIEQQIREYKKDF